MPNRSELAFLVDLARHADAIAVITGILPRAAPYLSPFTLREIEILAKVGLEDAATRQRVASSRESG